jgi:hypothetical protein
MDVANLIYWQDIFRLQRPPRLTAGRWYEYSSCAALYIYETTARSVKVGVSSTMTCATTRITRGLIGDETHEVILNDLAILNQQPTVGAN